MRRSPPRTKKATKGTRSKTPRAGQTRRRPVKRAGRFPWFTLILLVLCLAAGFWIGRRISPPSLHVPLFPLSQKIHVVDLAVKSQLYVLGLSEKNVVSRKSEVRRRGKQEWTQVTTTVQLPRAVPFDRIIRNLSREISTLGDEFTVIKKQDRSGILEVQIRIQDMVAHNLVIREPKVVKPQIPLKAQIAIVIDDLGQDTKTAAELLTLDAALSFSVLPFAPYSREFAGEAAKLGRDVLLHLPMEPKDYPDTDPGRGGLLTKMGRNQLLSQLEEDLSAVPHIKGVNNHMGSKFTEDPERMRTVLEVLAKRDLFFLDSRTTPGSVGFKTAREMGLKTGERSVFLDNEKDVSKIKVRISELIDLSHRNGGAIGIGHPHPETVQALREILPTLGENGVRLVPVSALLD